MNPLTLRALLFVGLLVCTKASWAQFGFGDKQTVPHLTIARAEIALDVPTPVQGNDLAFLLAQAQSGTSLSDIKEQAVQKFTTHLRAQLNAGMHEFFQDEEVPIVNDNQSLTLHSFIDVSVVKQLNSLKSGRSYELERGYLTAQGDFHFRLHNPAGDVLVEQRLDIANLKLKETYQLKTPVDGSAIEDNSDEQIEALLAELVKRLLNRSEDELEADALRELASAP